MRECETEIHVQKHHAISSGRMSLAAGSQCFIRKREQEQNTSHTGKRKKSQRETSAPKPRHGDKEMPHS